MCTLRHSLGLIIINYKAVSDPYAHENLFSIITGSQLKYIIFNAVLWSVLGSHWGNCDLVGRGH